MNVTSSSTGFEGQSSPGSRFLDPGLFAKGMAVLRIFFGIILFANGLAKVEPELGRIDIGAYHTNLVTRDGARGILNFEVNNRQIREGAPRGTQVPSVSWITNDVVLANWGFFGPFITIFELMVGFLLIVGLATRLGALLGLGQQLYLAAVYFSSNRWMFEQPHEYIPLMILAIVPAGRVWGIDALLIARNSRFARWPF